jgi:hypothetical protein
MKRAFLLLASLLGACGPGTPEAPRLVSISPAVQTTTESKTVIVELDKDPFFQVDYGQRTAELLGMPLLRVGPRQVVLDRYLGRGRFEATVGPGMEIGTHDVQVRLEDGREALLPEAYTVKATIDSYWFDTVEGTIFEGQPFTVTLHVTGRDAERFNGTVNLNLNRGKLSLPGQEPADVIRSGPFSNGVRREQLIISGAHGANVLLLVKDEEGRSATSNAFFVNSRQ